MKATCWRWIYQTDRLYLYRRKVSGSFEPGFVSRDLEEIKRRVCALHNITEADLLKRKPQLDIVEPPKVASAGPSGAQEPPSEDPVDSMLPAGAQQTGHCSCALETVGRLLANQMPANEEPESDAMDYLEESPAKHDVAHVLLSPRFGKIVAWVRLAVMSCMMPPDLHDGITHASLFVCPLVNFLISSLKYGCVRKELRNVLAVHPQSPNVRPMELYAMLVELCKRLPFLDFRIWSYHCRGGRGTGGYIVFLFF